MTGNTKKLFREEMPNGSVNEYEVDKFSENGQRYFYLLGIVQNKLQDVSDTYLILKESEAKLIESIKKELSDKNLVQEKDDGNENGKDKD